MMNPLKLLIVCIVLAAGCGGNDKEDPNLSDAAPVQADAGPNNESITWADYMEAVCPWTSICDADQDLESCYGLLSDTDLLSDPSIFQAGMQQRADCVKQASSCDDYQACPSEDSWFNGSASGYQCPGGKDVVCDPSTDILLVCFGAEAGVPPIIALDLSDYGKSCGPGDSFGDEPPQACTGNTCDGSIVRECINDSRVLSLDCANWDSDFGCDVEQKCSLLVPLCEENNFNNSGGSAQCSGNNTASICMQGKTYQITCPAASTCVNDGDLNASCTL